MPFLTRDASRVESGVAAHDDHRFGGTALRRAEVSDSQVAFRGQPAIQATSRWHACSRSSGVLKSRKSVMSGFFALYALSPMRVTTPVCVSRTSAQRFPAVSQGSRSRAHCRRRAVMTAKASPAWGRENRAVRPRLGDH